MNVVVIDTNVPVVANENHESAGPACVLSCIKALREAQHQIILIDGDTRSNILDEYRKHLSPGGQPGPGDAFFKWLWDNRYNPSHCRHVNITPLDEYGHDFAEFPDDPDLETFDRNDRKFVAVALASKLNRTASAFPTACCGVNERTPNNKNSLLSKIPRSLLRGSLQSEYSQRRRYGLVGF
jgi:hypothetical protein